MVKDVLVQELNAFLLQNKPKADNFMPIIALGPDGVNLVPSVKIEGIDLYDPT